MAITTSNLWTDAREMSGDDSTTVWTDAKMARWTTSLMHDICSRDQFPWWEETQTVTTTASTAAYAFGSTDVKKIIHVKHQDVTEPLTYLPYKDYLRLDTTSSGTPSHFYLFEEQIGFYPTPGTSSETITIHYIEHPATVASTDASLAKFPDRFEDVLLYGLMWRMKLQEAELGDADRFKQYYEQGIQKMRAELITARVDGQMHHIREPMYYLDRRVQEFQDFTAP